MLLLLRPKQWIKNLFVLAAPAFAGRLLEGDALMRVTLCFASFCLASSAVYILNDLRDREVDRLHPVKRYRPLAAGLVSPAFALVLAILLLIIGILVVVFFLNQESILILLGYLILNLGYTFLFKNIPVLDVGCIAGGFVLRAMAGATAAEVSASPWFVLCTLFLSLFLALGKRRHEFLLLGNEGANHCSVLAHYSINLIDQLVTVAGTCTVLTYALYTVASPIVAAHRGLVWTILPVIYGIFRYMYLLQIRDEGGTPEDTLLSDRHLLATVALYGAIVIYMLYAHSSGLHGSTFK
jgi:4-hydroxybenzoate polyprenyltransferase